MHGWAVVVLANTGEARGVVGSTAAGRVLCGCGLGLGIPLNYCWPASLIRFLHRSWALGLPREMVRKRYRKVWKMEGSGTANVGGGVGDSITQEWARQAAVEEWEHPLFMSALPDDPTHPAHATLNALTTLIYDQEQTPDQLAEHFKQRVAYLPTSPE